MTKRECINYIKKAQEEAHGEQLRRMKAKTPNIAEAMIECYNNCEQVCAENGYDGKCFVELWNRATDEKARGIRA